MTADAALHLKALAFQVRDADPQGRVFCSRGRGGHEYRFAPPLSESDVATFEQKHAVRLPPDYRAFIRHVGNGGAGPGYGVRPLKWEKAFDLRTVFRVGTASDLPADRGDPYAGCLRVCEHGCAYDDYLVVNGDFYGTMWAGDEDPGAVSLAGSFQEWYEQWATTALRRLKRDKLLDQVRGGQPLVEVVRLLGPVERTWGESPKVQERYVSFRDVCASIRLGKGDRVEEVVRLFIS